jgi:hypothetical protein
LLGFFLARGEAQAFGAVALADVSRWFSKSKCSSGKARIC